MITKTIEKNPGAACGPKERELIIDSENPTPVFLVGLVSKYPWGWTAFTAFNIDSSVDLRIDDKEDIITQHFPGVDLMADTSGLTLDQRQELEEQGQEDTEYEGGLFEPEVFEEGSENYWIQGFLDLDQAKAFLEIKKRELSLPSDILRLEIRKMEIPAGQGWFKVIETWGGETDAIAFVSLQTPSDGSPQHVNI